MTLATMVLADLTLEGLIWWIIVGLIAGFLASVVMRGGGYGIVGDIIAGIIGAFIGGWLFARRRGFAIGKKWLVLGFACQLGFLVSLYLGSEFLIGGREWMWKPPKPISLN